MCRMFPLMPENRRDPKPGPLSIPWSIAEKAYGVYASRYGREQSLSRLAERGGFYVGEMDDLYPQWRAEVDRITELTTENERLKQWKESAISVTPPMQEIARELGIPLGESIHDQILPRIVAIKSENERLRKDAELIERVVAKARSVWLFSRGYVSEGVEIPDTPGDEVEHEEAARHAALYRSIERLDAARSPDLKSTGQ